MENPENCGILAPIPGDPTRAAPLPTRKRRGGGARALEHLRAVELVELIVARRADPSPLQESAAVDAWLLRHSRASAVEWSELLQIPVRSALRLASAFELGRRAADSRPARAPIRTPRDAFERVRAALANRDREAVVALYLDGRHRVLLQHEVSVGTATASLIHPREVFGPALRAGACAVVVAHNHPSGDPEPSLEDRGVTDRLHAAGELVGIPLLDHLVIGGSEFVSLRGRGAWGAAAGQDPAARRSAPGQDRGARA